MKLQRIFKSDIAGLGAGDINGTAKGTGARYNNGKVPYDILPLIMLVDWLEKHNQTKIEIGNSYSSPQNILRYLSRYQGGDNIALDVCLLMATDCVGLQGFAGAAKVFDHVTNRPVKPYPKWNWIRGMNWSIPIGCAVRHLLAEIDGEVIDPETGLKHRDHCMCNLIMLLQFRETYKEGDDRPPIEFL